MIKLLVISILILLSSFGSTGCSCYKTYHPGGPYYYAIGISYFIPDRPTHEITKAEALEGESRGESYYIAFFNNDGFIKSLEERIGGKRTFKREYFYEKKRLARLEKTDSKGVRSTVIVSNNNECL